jgi:hypothetical protein
MSEKESIYSGTITFTTDDIFIGFEGHDQNVDVSGEVVFQPNFNENPFNHQHASVLGHMGERSLDGIPNSSLRVRSLIAKKAVLQSDIALRAFNFFQSGRGGSAVDNWLRAERELLGI